MTHYISDFFYRPTSVVQVCRKGTPHIMCRFGWYYIVKADETKNRIIILEDALELYETKQGCHSIPLKATKERLGSRRFSLCALLIRKSLVFIYDKKCFSSFFCVMYGIMFTNI